MRKKSTHGLTHAPRTDYGDGSNWLLFPHLKVQTHYAAAALKRRTGVRYQGFPGAWNREPNTFVTLRLRASAVNNAL
jgi:hypothetical protein